MSSSKVYASLAGGALALAATSGCFISAEPSPGMRARPGARTGSVSLTWTVAGSASPSACTQFGAFDLELIVRDRGGRAISTESAPCSDFTLTVPLPPGDYTADATLVDARGYSVTTTLPVRDVRITRGSDLVIDIDFPSTTKL